MLCDYDAVNVIEGSLTPKSKCDIKSCKSHPKFMIFNDDGATKMSRLFFCSCGNHLPIAIRRAWAENRDCKQKRERKVKREEKAKARKLLGV